MADFFQLPEPPPERERPKPQRQRPWWMRPRGELAGVMPLELVVAKNDLAAVAISRVGAYSAGFEFELVIMLSERGAEADIDPSLFHPGPRRRRGPGAEGDQLRFGVQFADGSKATNLDRSWAEHRDEPPPGPVLRTGGGGGGDSEWRQSIWVWPLPPPGPLAFVCEWPVAGIELTRVEIDAQQLIDAAARAQRIFGEPAGESDADASSSGSVTASVITQTLTESDG